MHTWQNAPTKITTQRVFTLFFQPAQTQPYTIRHVQIAIYAACLSKQGEGEEEEEEEKREEEDQIDIACLLDKSLISNHAPSFIRMLICCIRVPSSKCSFRESARQHPLPCGPAGLVARLWVHASFQVGFV
jgi:hypothetical protein